MGDPFTSVWCPNKNKLGSFSTYSFGAIKAKLLPLLKAEFVKQTQLNCTYLIYTL